MSRAANCYDNAFMESCFGTIKTELEMTEYDHCHAARLESEFDAINFVPGQDSNFTIYSIAPELVPEAHILPLNRILPRQRQASSEAEPLVVGLGQGTVASTIWLRS